MRLPIVPAVALLLTHSMAVGSSTAGDKTVSFRAAVVNLDWAHSHFRSLAPPSIRSIPSLSGGVWFGVISHVRGVEVNGNPSGQVGFVAEYRAGVPARAFYDHDWDGELAEQDEVTLLSYPLEPAGKSFLVQMAWPDPVSGPRPQPEVIRVILSPLSGDRPSYRIQRVRAQIGVIEVSGMPHKAFLYDGNWDGTYTREFGDGMFFDANGDGSVVVDPMDEEFAAFGLPFEVGGETLQITDVSPSGETIRLRSLGRGSGIRRAVPGEAAPEVVFRDTDGIERRLSALRGKYVLLYFWASWCGTCSYQAPRLADLTRRFGESRIAILGISYDTDREKMMAFRQKFEEVWPTSFEGRIEHENSVGRTYRAGGAGLIFLVDPRGTLVGQFSDVAELEERLVRLESNPKSSPRTATPKSSLKLTPSR